MTTAAGAGYMSRVITSPDGDILEDRVVSATGSYNATAPLSGGSWVMQVVAFRAASGTSSPAPSITSLSPVSGAVGTAVTITGSNFGSTKGTSTVTFNGTAATPTSWSATSIVVPVPAGATTGNVVVTVGGVASNADDVYGRQHGAEHHEPVAGQRRGGDGRDDHGLELRIDKGHEHGDVQRHDGDADELVGDEHRRPGARRARRPGMWW